MARTMTLIPGDGIGPVVSAAMFGTVRGTAPGLGGAPATTAPADASCHHIEYTDPAPSRPA
jgi:isocitrate/isopropylmalate dehydrogenase